MILPTRRLPSVWKTPRCSNRSIRRQSHDADYTTHVSPAIFGIESQTDSVILIYVHFQQYNHKPVQQIKNNKIKHNLFAFKWKLEKYLWKVQQINYEMNQELQFNHKTCDVKEIVMTKK